MVSIELSSVTLLRGGRELVSRASLSIATGEMVVVTGARGAGKTLLLAAAAGAIEPAAGQVLVAGREMGSLQASARPYVRRNIGYLPPEPPFLRDETGLDNVMIALATRGLRYAEAEIIARRTLGALGADGCAHRLGRELSLGERRLCALARALSGPPPIIVLDEPSAGLGALDRERLCEVLFDARSAGAALLCASNDAALVERLRGNGARHLVLDDGHLTGERAHLRALEQNRSDGSDGPGDDGKGRGGGVVLGFPPRAREVS